MLPQEPEKPKPEQFGLTEEKVSHFRFKKTFNEVFHSHIGLFTGALIGLYFSINLVVFILGAIGAFIGYKYGCYLNKMTEETEVLQTDFANYLKYCNANRSYENEKRKYEDIIL